MPFAHLGTFYGYRESNVLAQELDRIRQGIAEYLLPAQPRAAAELRGRLIRLDANVYERADGVIGDAIGEAVTDCGRAWAADPERDPKILAAEVFDLFTTDEYGARGEVIRAFSQALGAPGLDELECMVRERLDHAPAGKHDYRQRVLTTALENIADGRGDVDGYIAAQRLAGTENLAVKAIGERLLAAGRLEEALHWVDCPDVPEHKRGDIGPLKVNILDRLGRTEDAQAVRWSIFATSLSAGILDEYLTRLPQDIVAEAHQRAIATACRYPDVHQSLHLLAELSPDIAADLVHRRLGEIRGEAYWALRPVADRLTESHPVAAILLYRQMADAVLRRGQSQYYDHAVRDLIAAERLVPNAEVGASATRCEVKDEYACNRARGHHHNRYKRTRWHSGETGSGGRSEARCQSPVSMMYRTKVSK
jgi:hypothetical protein